MDFSEKTNFFTMDVITDLATGKPFGNLTEDKDLHDYLRIAAKAHPVFVLIGVLPLVNKILQIPAIGKMVFPSAQDEIGMGKLIRLVNFLRRDNVMSGLDLTWFS